VAITNGQSRESWVHKTKKKANTICIGHYYSQTNIRHNSSYTQTEGKDELNIIVMKK